nr:NADH dehydrogenase subunit 4 [Meteorus sp. 2 XHS-2023a]
MMKMIIFFMYFNILIIFFKKYMTMSHLILFLTIPLFLMNFNLKYMYMYNLYYLYGFDSINFNLILLSLWIINLAFMSNYKFIFKKFNKNFLSILIILMIILIMCFSTTNLFLFYIFFESSLIPLIMLIMGWGMQIDRIQASMYMLFYTLFGSLPLLILFIYMNMNMYSLSMNFLNLNNIYTLNNLYFFSSMFFAFLIKTPMYIIHLWLPKAHVEAPVSGSMILAGIMLKLGTYGMYRLIPIFNNDSIFFNSYMIPMLLMGSMISSLICLNQNDLKIIVAYSSIVHMNMMVASMFTLSLWSFTGSMWMMISHGLCSSGLFCLVNFLYERSNSRNILINKGVMNLFPAMTLWWFLLCSSNFSAPPSLNLFSEIFLINGLLIWMKFNLMYLIIIMFFGTLFSIYLFSFSQHNYMFKMIKLKFNNIFEFLIIMLHWIPLNFTFLIIYLMI